MSADLTPRVQGLAAALLDAKVAATRAKPGDDGGSANLDSVFLFARRGLTSAMVETACDLAGVQCSRSSSRMWRGWFLSLGDGQGAMRTRMVEAACRALTAAGEDAGIYYLLD